MNQHTVSSKPRYIVRHRVAKSGRFAGRDWAVIDLQRYKIDSRFINRDSAEMVAEGLNGIHAERVARQAPPAGYRTDESGWLMVGPEIEPAEHDDRDEPTAQDRRDWAAMSNQGDDGHDVDGWDEAYGGTLLASLDDNLSAFLDRVGADYLERDVPESELVEFGVIGRR